MPQSHKTKTSSKTSSQTKSETGFFQGWGAGLFSPVYTAYNKVRDYVSYLLKPDTAQIIKDLNAGKCVVLEVEDKVATSNIVLQVKLVDGKPKLGMVGLTGHVKFFEGDWEKKVTELMDRIGDKIVDVTEAMQTESKADQPKSIDPERITRDENSIAFYDAEAKAGGKGKTIRFTGPDREQKLQLYLNWVQSYHCSETEEAQSEQEAEHHVVRNVLVGALAISGAIWGVPLARKGAERVLDSVRSTDVGCAGALVFTAASTMFNAEQLSVPSLLALSTLMCAKQSEAAQLESYQEFNIETIPGSIEILGSGGVSSDIGVVAAGDVNGDGVTDLALARPSEVDVIYGKKDATAWPSQITLPDYVSDGKKGFRIIIGDVESIAVQDTNRDGKSDVVMGLPNADKVVTVFGRENFPPVFNVSQMSPEDGFVIYGEKGSKTGYAVEGNDDFLMIGAPEVSSDGKAEAGSTAVIPSRATWPAMFNFTQVTSLEIGGTLFNGENPSDQSGSGVGIVKDQTGTRLIIGSPGAYSSAGEAYVMLYNVSFSGKAVTLSSVANEKNIVIVGSKRGDQVGTEILGIDGSQDSDAYVVLGTPYFANGDALGSGAVWGFSLEAASAIARNGTQIYTGTETYPQEEGFFSMFGDVSNVNFGYALAFVPGKANSPDMLAIGGPGEDMPSCVRAGKAYVFEGPIGNFDGNVTGLYLTCQWPGYMYIGGEVAGLDNFYGSKKLAMYVDAAGLKKGYIIPKAGPGSSSSYSSTSASETSSSTGSASSSAQFSSSSSEQSSGGSSRSGGSSDESASMASSLSASSSGSSHTGSDSLSSSVSSSVVSRSSSPSSSSLPSSVFPSSGPSFFSSSSQADKHKLPWWVWLLVASGTVVAGGIIIAAVVAARKYRKNPEAKQLLAKPEKGVAWVSNPLNKDLEDDGGVNPGYDSEGAEHSRMLAQAQQHQQQQVDHPRCSVQ